MTEKAVKGKVNRRVFTAQQKCQAVLSVWSESRKPHQICVELGINWAMLHQWQHRAMSGMMDALEPRQKKMVEKKPPLGPRLERLLDQTVKKRDKTSKAGRRLETIQKGVPSP